MNKILSKSIKMCFTFILCFTLLTSAKADSMVSNEVVAESGGKGDGSFTLTKSTEKTAYNVEDTISYTLKVDLTKYSGNTITSNYIITDTLPEGMKLVCDTANPKSSIEVDYRLSGSKDYKVECNDNSFTVNIDNTRLWLTSSYGIIITYDAVVEDYNLAGKTITNTATASVQHVSGRESFDQSVTAELTLAILKPKFDITKEVDKESAELGDTVKYTIKVKQIVEEAIAKNVILTDEIPEGLIIDEDSITLEDAEYEFVDGVLKITVDELAYNDELVITFNAIISENYGESKLENVATVKADNNTDETKATSIITIPSLLENPDTSDNIIILIYMMIISLIGIIILSSKKKSAILK